MNVFLEIYIGTMNFHLRLEFSCSLDVKIKEIKIFVQIIIFSLLIQWSIFLAASPFDATFGLTLGIRRDLALDTDNTFTESYRRKLCEKAVKQIATRRVKILSDTNTGSNLHYAVFESDLNRKVVRAFKCHTEPPLYLEVRKTDYQAYSVTIFFRKSDDLVDDNNDNEVHYIVKFVDTVTEGKIFKSLT